MPWLLTHFLDVAKDLFQSNADHDLVQASTALGTAMNEIEPYYQGKAGAAWHAGLADASEDQLVQDTSAFSAHCKPSVFDPLVTALTNTHAKLTTLSSLYGAGDDHKDQLSDATERLHTARVTQLEVKVATTMRLLSTQPMKLKRTLTKTKSENGAKYWVAMYKQLQDIADSKLDIGTEPPKKVAKI